MVPYLGSSLIKPLNYKTYFKEDDIFSPFNLEPSYQTRDSHRLKTQKMFMVNSYRGDKWISLLVALPSKVKRDCDKDQRYGGRNSEVNQSCLNTTATNIDVMAPEIEKSIRTNPV